MQLLSSTTINTTRTSTIVDIDEDAHRRADERLCEIRFRQLEKGEVDSMQDTGRDVIPLGMISG